ncbi:elongation factor P--(R)-beta-lysine ligase [Maricurvus nonylphenolicus]|uniref:EF-P lysine aminoacylase EpmA n=1 Tax=Maricurvus nonylphenolicus TaxID=1008307 RepID=UPI0036F1BD5A
MTPSFWLPSASLEQLRARAALYQTLRNFFAQRNVLEIDVPVLAKATVTDPHIDSIVARCGDDDVFLQTSPEFFMKRLLCAGSGPIFSLGKAFRNGEVGRKHNPEFTMLEWYRPGFDDHQLMDEVEALIQQVMPITSVERLSYRDIFQRVLSIDPHSASLETLRALAKQHVELDWDDDNRDTWLDILMTHVIEPQLGEGLVFIYDYPASQCALARIEKDRRGQKVAKRFEAYVKGIELANGYWELTDVQEQAERFKQDQLRRQELNLPNNPSDGLLLDALANGMPDAAGVALGVDRLLMLQQGVDSLEQVLAFPFSRV